MPDFNQGFAFLLVIVRMTAFLAASPVFSLRNIPQGIKILMCIVMAALIMPQVSLTEFTLPRNYLETMGMVICETITGLAAGLGASIVFAALRTAGQFLDIHIGFAAAQLFDPMSSEQNTLLALFFNMLGIVLFFSLDAHHQLIIAVTQSFYVIPLGNLIAPEATMLALLQVFGIMVDYALRIALPVIIVLFLFDLGLGFISRAVPQFNVLMAGFPLKIFVGIIALSLVLPLLGTLVGIVFQIMEKEVNILFGFR